MRFGDVLVLFGHFRRWMRGYWRHVKRQGPVLMGFLLVTTRVSGVGFGGDTDCHFPGLNPEVTLNAAHRCYMETSVR